MLSFDFTGMYMYLFVTSQRSLPPYEGYAYFYKPLTFVNMYHVYIKTGKAEFFINFFLANFSSFFSSAGFTIQKVPKDLDAIVVGSGIGGLALAGILAKAGKRVLVLEQHDQAGGCCHTFKEKGYEFDVGRYQLTIDY